ncbi:hypothetical protein BS47DRAFT_1357014 [Hydnum rufescens UP504]|uniref:Exonuclease domain-containing protein n=1 Tax=Hydnum rufescens UP504 TaxID=1448309 RepID=A0A9P6E2H8_9AGAM|nr:hypothetical protein BS47DRAFT_1357014 [Hydnum rufescens UP504]
MPTTTTQRTHSLPFSWLLGVISIIILSVALFVYQFLTISSFDDEKVLSQRDIAHVLAEENVRRNNSVANVKPAPPSTPPISILVHHNNYAAQGSIPSGPSSPTESLADTLVEDQRIKQPIDSFLVVDVEATCCEGAGFDYPNEIIEWPVVLLRWADKDEDGRASELVKVAEFRSYVRPSWRPVLSPFCTSLTGITQADVNPAPAWPAVLDAFSQFLADHGLIDAHTGARLERFMFCSDGPFDVSMPEYLRGDILDIRRAVTGLLVSRDQFKPMLSTATNPPYQPHHMRRVSLNVPLQLRALSLPPFIGDARNIARILIELGKIPLRLEPNTYIHPHRKWWWMTNNGEVAFPTGPQPA